ncbi:hypothetical protein E3P99_02408 [Wallemia hederae]|uniref:Piwi domain-containing protein n=1 Tax=Wallemia hederae TaxID=1540922 RepID=A0A4T0FKH9_9BASI|nr:hypothetical protein E3P99_02408 [Wallemia hederae]
MADTPLVPSFIAITPLTTTTISSCESGHVAFKGRSATQTEAVRIEGAAPATIYVYDVHIEAAKPKMRNWAENLRAMRFFLTHECSFGRTCAYDGQALLYSSVKLPIDGEISTVFNLPASSDTPVVDSSTGERKGVQNTVSLKPVSQISTNIQGNPQINEFVAALNTVVRYCATLSHPSNKRVFYPIGGHHMDISNGAKLLRSWFTTTRLASNSIVLNIDTSSIKLLREGRLHEVAPLLIGLNGPVSMTVGPGGRLQNQQRQLLGRLLKRVKVETNHNPNRKQTFAIQEVSDKNADTFIFEDSNGNKLSISAYLKKTYNITLRHPQLPVVGKSKTVFVPMELLNVLPGQLHPDRVLNPVQTRDMMAFCKVNPFQRLNDCRNQAFSISRDNPITDQFGFRIDSRAVQCSASVISPSSLEYKGHRQIKPSEPDVEWDRPSQNLEFFAPANIKNWTLLAFGRPDDYKWLSKFLKDLAAMCKKRGMRVPHDPEIRYIRNENADVDKIRDELKRLKLKTDFILATCKFEKSNAYRAIKQFCDIDLGVPSQFFVAKKASTAKPTYISNLVLKVNVKAGGINQTLGTTNPYFAHKDKAICFGVDVTHPPPGPGTTISIAGVVSNTDQRVSKFVGSEVPLKVRQEIIEDLKDVVKKHVNAYKDNNHGAIPRHVLYLRDGVSEGQYQEVLRHERKAILDAYRELGVVPKITFVVGQKRHHVRFAPDRGQQTDKSGNCRSGTIIDHPSVTRPDQFEFYAYTHSGLMGTSRPCRYVVIHDDYGFNVETLSQTIYATSLTYQIANRAVSLASPVYYAHKLADRARLHLNAKSAYMQTHSNLRNISYFV